MGFPAPADPTGVGNAESRIALDVSDLSAFRTSACARRSRFPQRAKPGHGHLGAHLRPLCWLRANDLDDDQALATFWQTAKLPHGQRVYRRAA
jgi:hypothetical protein